MGAGRPEVKRVREFWYMEVSSCTEWKINSAMVSFNSNCYVEVGKEGVDAKVKSLSMCRGVMRPYHHTVDKYHMYIKKYGETRVKV